MSVAEEKKSSVKEEVKTDLSLKEGYFSLPPSVVNSVSSLFPSSRRSKHRGHTRSYSTLDQAISKGNAAIEIDKAFRVWVDELYEKEIKKATEEKKEQPAVAAIEEKVAEGEAAQISRALSFFVQFEDYNSDTQESSNAFERIFAANFASALNKNPETKRDLFISPRDIQIAYTIRAILDNILRSSNSQGFFNKVLQNTELTYDKSHTSNNFVDERTYAQVTDEVPYNICARMLSQLGVYIAYFETLKARANRYWWGSLLAWFLLLPALTLLLPIGWTLLWLSGVSKAEAMSMVANVASSIFAGGWWIDISLGLSLIIGFIAILKAYANRLDATEAQIVSANAVPPPFAEKDVDDIAKKVIYSRVYSVLIEYMKQCGHLKTDDYIKIKLAELKEARTRRLEEELIATFCRLYLTPTQIKSIQAGDTENRIVPGCKKQTIKWALKELKDILHTIPDFFKDLSGYMLTKGQIKQIRELAESQLLELQQLLKASNPQISQLQLSREIIAYETVLKNFDEIFPIVALEQKALEERAKVFKSTEIDEKTLHAIPDFFKELSEHRLSEEQIQQIKALAESQLIQLRQKQRSPNLQISQQLLAKEIVAYEAVLKNFGKIFPIVVLEKQTLDAKINLFKNIKTAENRSHWWEIISRLQIWKITQAQLVGQFHDVDAELGIDWLGNEVTIFLTQPSSQRQETEVKKQPSPQRQENKHHLHRSRSSIDVSQMFAASFFTGSTSTASASNSTERVVESKEEANTPPNRLIAVQQSSSIIASSASDVSMSSASALTVSFSPSASSTNAPKMVLVTEEDQSPQSMTQAQFSKKLRKELKQSLGRIGAEANKTSVSEETEEDVENEEDVESVVFG